MPNVSGLPYWQAEAIRGSVVQKFGRNPAIETTSDPEDVWAGGGLLADGAFWMSTTSQQVVSSSDLDKSGGSGVTEVVLIGQNRSGIPQKQVVELNGTTPVALDGTWLNVWRAYLQAAEGTGTAGGNITISANGTTANIIPVGYNQTLTAAYTVPRNKDAAIIRWTASMARASGAAGSAQIALQTRDYNDYTLWRTREVQDIVTGGPFSKEIAINLNGGDDIRIRVIEVSDNATMVSAQFDLMEF